MVAIETCDVRLPPVSIHLYATCKQPPLIYQTASLLKRPLPLLPPQQYPQGACSRHGVGILAKCCSDLRFRARISAPIYDKLVALIGFRRPIQATSAKCSHVLSHFCMLQFRTGYLHCIRSSCIQPLWVQSPCIQSRDVDLNPVSWHRPACSLAASVDVVRAGRNDNRDIKTKAHAHSCYVVPLVGLEGMQHSVCT